jgi:hypothetical protein
LHNEFLESPDYKPISGSCRERPPEARAPGPATGGGPRVPR